MFSLLPWRPYPQIINLHIQRAQGVLLSSPSQMSHRGEAPLCNNRTGNSIKHNTPRPFIISHSIIIMCYITASRYNKRKGACESQLFVFISRGLSTHFTSLERPRRSCWSNLCNRGGFFQLLSPGRGIDIQSSQSVILIIYTVTA